MAECRHPEIEVELIGQDGNAFMVLGLASRALRRAGVSQEERDEFMKDATSGDYNHLLMVVQNWVTVTGPSNELDEADDEEDDIDDILDDLDDDEDIDDDDLSLEDLADDIEKEETLTEEDETRLDDIGSALSSS